MKRIALFSLTLFALGVVTTPVSANEVSPSKVREQFWESQNEKLQLASEALGDNNLMEFLEKLLDEKNLDPAIKRIIEKLTK